MKNSSKTKAQLLSELAKLRRQAEKALSESEAKSRVSRDVIARKQAEEILQRTSRQQEQLLQTARYLTASLDLTEVLTRIGAVAIEILKAHGCAIYLLEADGKTLTPKVAIEPPYEQEILSTPLDVETSFTGQAVKAKRGLIFNSAASDSSGHQIPGTPSEPKESVITAPFIVEDKVLGAMCLDRIGTLFSEEDLALGEAFATYAAIALKNAQTHHDLEHEVKMRRRAEQVLRESEERYRSLIEASPDAITLTDLDGRVLICNEQAALLYGCANAQELIGKSAFEFIAPEDRLRAVDNARKTFQTGSISNVEYTLLKKDGSRYQVELNVSLMVDADGKPRAFTGVVRDITERKRAEEQVQRLNRDLTRRARELVALDKAGRAMASSLDLTEVLSVVIVEVRSLMGAEGASLLLRESDELVFAAADSPGVKALLGTRMPATAGIAGAVLQNKRGTRVDNAQTDPRFYSRVDAATGLTTRSLLAVPLVFKGEAQGVLEVINKASGAFDEDDLELLEAIAGSAATAIANARLYQAEREQYRRLQISQAKLIQAEKMEALGRLIASIAHEINNPLQAVMGCLELFHEELENGSRWEKLQRYLDIVETETERIAAIVRRVRDFYRPARQEMRLTDVHSVLNSVLELAGKQLQNNNVTVEREWMEALPTIQANPDHLKQVFLNLTLNAADAMAKRGGTLHVRTAMDQVQGAESQSLPAARIEISDTGEGMSPEVLANLFEPFFTTRASGTGLGLAISYEIIQAHNGQITATSQLGVGTTFVILLPVRQP